MALHSHAYGPLVTPANYGRRIKRTVVKAATYTILPTDEYIVAAVNCVITLPLASSVFEGSMVVVCNPDPTNVTSVTVKVSGSDTIEGITDDFPVNDFLTMAPFISDGVDNWETFIAYTEGN